MRKLLVLLLWFILASSVFAKEAPTVAADPVLEKRAMALAEELRCLVCQNQTIADSHAELAVDLKNQIREKLKAGMSEAQIIDYMVARYGEFVLLRPRMSWHTAILWGAPLTILIIGLFAIGFSVLRRSARPGLPEVAALTEGEKLKLNAIESQLDSA